MNRAASTTARRFIGYFLCWSLIPVGLIGLFNLLVDPLRLLPLEGIVGLNAVKPMLRDHERLFKPYAVARLRPQAVIFGTSRSNHALDPEHAAWHGLQAYNFSVSGTTIREIRELFEDAVAKSPMKVAVIELDLGLFDDADDRTRSGPGILSAPGKPNRVGPLLGVASTALAWNTVPLSLGTLSGQRAGEEYDALGLQTDRVFRWRIASYGGVRRTFEGYMLRLAPEEKKQAAAWTASGVTVDRFPGMGELRQIMQLAARNGITLMLYISPTHALDVEAAHAIYGWDRLEEWKRSLVDTIDQERAAARASGTAGSSEVALWDFSGYSSVTTEDVPGLADDRSQMRYYWDQSHYRRLVGDWVIDRMFGLQPAGAAIPADFGILLTRESLEPHFAQTRSASEAYRSNHPAEAAFIRRLAADDTGIDPQDRP
jgi:hypothetical protein